MEHSIKELKQYGMITRVYNILVRIEKITTIEDLERVIEKEGWDYFRYQVKNFGKVSYSNLFISYERWKRQTRQEKPQKDTMMSYTDLYELAMLSIMCGSGKAGTYDYASMDSKRLDRLATLVKEFGKMEDTILKAIPLKEEGDKRSTEEKMLDYLRNWEKRDKNRLTF